MRQVACEAWREGDRARHRPLAALNESSRMHPCTGTPTNSSGTGTTGAAVPRTPARCYIHATAAGTFDATNPPGCIGSAINSAASAKVRRVPGELGLGVGCSLRTKLHNPKYQWQCAGASLRHRQLTNYRGRAPRIAIAKATRHPRKAQCSSLPSARRSGSGLAQDQARARHAEHGPFAMKQLQHGCGRKGAHFVTRLVDGGERRDGVDRGLQVVKAN